MSERLYSHRLLTTLLFAVALLLCLGGLAVQDADADAGDREGGTTGVVDSHAALDGAHLPVPMETPDSEEKFPVGYEHLNALALGLFLVSLGLLLGAGLAGRAFERRLLELSRLPSSTPVAPARAPLSALEVFRI